MGLSCVCRSLDSSWMRRDVALWLGGPPAAARCSPLKRLVGFAWREVTVGGVSGVGVPARSVYQGSRVGSQNSVRPRAVRQISPVPTGAVVGSSGEIVLQ